MVKFRLSVLKEGDVFCAIMFCFVDQVYSSWTQPPGKREPQLIVPIRLPVIKSVGAFSWPMIDVEGLATGDGATPGQVGLGCIRNKLSRPREASQ